MISTRLVAYAPGADVPLGYLPEPLSWQCSLPHNDVGALTLKYSTLAARGDLLGRGLAEGLDVALEVDFGSGWIEPDGGRFLLRTRSRNLAGTDGVLDLTLPSYGALLADMRILALDLLEVGGEFDGQRLFTAVNAGKILRPLLDEYASRHAQASALTWNFTDALDSALVAWPSTEWAIPYQAGVDLRSVLGSEQTAGLTSLGLCDWRTRGRELMAWVKDSQAVDRSALVRLELTRDIRDAPLTETLDGTAGYTLVRGEGSVIATVISEDAPSPWGVAEAYLTASGATSVEAAQEMVALEVERRAREAAEYTQQLTLDPDGVLPLRDYLPGDVISAQSTTGRRAMRVQQVTLSMDGGTLSGSVILNDRLVPADLRVAGRLRAITGGSAAGGTGGVPSAPPLPIPAAPTGVALSSLGYWASSSPRSSVSASWVAVTQSTESKPIAIDHYVMRVSGGLETTAPGTSATIDGLTPSTPVQVQVAAVSDKGVQGAWSAPESITTAVTLSRLDPPVALVLSTGDGTVRASWDGTLQAPPAAAHAAPPEFARLRVEVGTSGSGPWTAAGSLDTPGRWIIPATPGQTVWVRGVAVDRLGLESVPGPVSSIEVESEVAEAVAEALGKAEQALDDAADAQTTADGKNRVTTSVDEPPAEGREQGDRWYVVDPDEAGQITTVKVWNGTAWVLYREVAGSVLVPGSVGSVLIEDGAVIAPKLYVDQAMIDALAVDTLWAGKITAIMIDADAINGKTITGVTINGGTINGGTIYSEDPDVSSTTITGGRLTSIDEEYSDAEVEIYRGQVTLTSTDGSTLVVNSGGLISTITDGVTSSSAWVDFEDDGLRVRFAGETSISRLHLLDGVAEIHAGADDLHVRVNTYGVSIVDKTTTSSTNTTLVALDGMRVLRRSTSLRASKTLIEDIAPALAARQSSSKDSSPAGFLGLRPRSWYDRGEVERAGLDPDATTETECLAAGLRRIPGFVAEEVAAVDPLYVTYDEDECGVPVLSGVAYDRLTSAIHPVLTDLAARVAALESAR